MTFNKTIVKSVRNLLYYTIKFDTYLIFTFTRTPLYFLWVHVLILGLFGGAESDLVNFYCLLSVMYIIGTATLISVVCSSKTTRLFVENIVGASFLEEFVPRKGVTNLLLLFLPFILLLFLDVISIEHIVSSKFQEYQEHCILAHNYFSEGNFEMSEKTRGIASEIIESTSGVKGIVGQLVRNPYFMAIHGVFSKMLGL